MSSADVCFLPNMLSVKSKLSYDPNIKSKYVCSFQAESIALMGHPFKNLFTETYFFLD